MILRFLNWISWQLPSRMIRNADGSPYLHRVSIIGRLPGQKEAQPLGIYLHHFHSADHGGLHNHPWAWSFSICLRGGYIEERELGDGSVIKRPIRPGMINPLGRGVHHRVLELRGDECWTLFFVWRKAFPWGFRDRQPIEALV